MFLKALVFLPFFFRSCFHPISVICRLWFFVIYVVGAGRLFCSPSLCVPAVFGQTHILRLENEGQDPHHNWRLLIHIYSACVYVIWPWFVWIRNQTFENGRVNVDGFKLIPNRVACCSGATVQWLSKHHVLVPWVLALQMLVFTWFEDGLVAILLCEPPERGGGGRATVLNPCAE